MSIASPPLTDYQRSLLELVPDQGCWSERKYLELTEHASRLVEYTDGNIEILPMPTDLHQRIVQFMFLAFNALVAPMGGTVQFAPLRVRIRRGMYREPDVLLVKSADDRRRANRYWAGADLVLEVVSPDDPDRDLVEKRRDYAEGNIPEYWIVNPQTKTIAVLCLESGAYAEHGVFGPGQHATSVLLPGFSVDVTEAFDVDCPPEEPDAADQ